MTKELLVKNKKTVQQQNIFPDEKVSINRVSTHKPSLPRRRLIDSSEIKPNTKYISGLKGKRSIVGLTAYDAIMSIQSLYKKISPLLFCDSALAKRSKTRVRSNPVSRSTSKLTSPASAPALPGFHNLLFMTRLLDSLTGTGFGPLSSLTGPHADCGSA